MTKESLIKPVIVLMLICLFISAALAFIDNVTSPIISAAAAERAEAARREVMPEADAFKLLDAEDDLPGTVKEVYKAENGAGYVFMLTTKGYGGEMELICGIGSDGRITACKTLSHGETAGLGAKTAGDDYRNQYRGQGADLAGVNAISGATISSTAYSKAVKDAFAAYDMITK